MSTDDHVGDPGGHARERYREGLRRWRAYLRFRLLALLAPSLVLGMYLGVEGSSQWKWPGGALFGSAATLWWWARDDPPDYIENWNRGFEGETRTARALSALPAGWRVWHDVPAANGNVDHIVLGPAGLFVLDSKLLRGELCVDGDDVRVRRRLADDSDYSATRAAQALLARAMELRAHLRETTRFSEYVQAVIVVWSPFPQGQATSRHAVFLAGKLLVPWLVEQPPRYAPAHVQRLARAIDERVEGVGPQDAITCPEASTRRAPASFHA